jgi:hypothetical protein
MTELTKDFEYLMHNDYNIYIESDDDNSAIMLEARKRTDDMDVVKASYTPDGERIYYRAENFVKNIIELLNPTRV